MSIYNQLQEDMVKAMKEKNSVALEVIRSAIDAIQKAAIAKKCKNNITEELVNEVLIKEQKTIQEMIDTCPKGREDLLNQYRQKLEVIVLYAPQLLTDPIAIRTRIICELAAAGIEPVKANKGAAMKLLMPMFKGKADMKVVNQIIGEVLQ